MPASSLIVALVAVMGGTAAATGTCPAPPPGDRPIEFCGEKLARDTTSFHCMQRVEDLCPLAGLPQLRALRNRTSATLVGVELLVHLESLDIAGSKVTDYSALASLHRLKHLNLDSSRIADLKPLATLTELETLDLSSTDASDWGPLAGLTKLRSLDIDWDKVVDLEPLGKLVSLRRLSMRRMEGRGTQIKDFSPLARLTELEYLDVSGTTLRDVAQLGKLTKLKQLWVTQTSLENLDGITNLRALEDLELSYTHITSLRPLYGLKHLRRVFNHDLAELELDEQALAKRERQRLQRRMPKVQLKKILTTAEIEEERERGF